MEFLINTSSWDGIQCSQYCGAYNMGYIYITLPIQHAILVCLNKVYISNLMAMLMVMMMTPGIYGYSILKPRYERGSR